MTLVWISPASPSKEVGSGMVTPVGLSVRKAADEQQRQDVVSTEQFGIEEPGFSFLKW